MFQFNRYRKRMFVSGRIQGRLMTRIALYWVLYHVVLWHALFVFRAVQVRMSGGLATSPVPFSELYGQFVIDYYPVIVCAVVTLPIVLIDMLHMTHRIAGPLVRFKHALRDLIAGKQVEQVTLRKGDLLTEFQQEFNEYLAILARQRQQEGEQEQKEGESTNRDTMSEHEAKIVAHVTNLRTSVQEALMTHESDEVVSDEATTVEI